MCNDFVQRLFCQVHNLCLLYTVFKEKHWKLLFHLKIANDLRMCYELDPGSVVQVQGHLGKKMLFSCPPYLAYMEMIRS